MTLKSDIESKQPLKKPLKDNGEPLVNTDEEAETVAAALVALGVPAPADDVRARAHASRDDAEIARAGAHGALAGEVYLPPPVALARHVVVVAVDRGRLRVERPELR